MGLGSRATIDKQLNNLQAQYWNPISVCRLSTVEIVKDRDNRLLSRREYVFSFKGGSGLVSRQSALEAIATRVGVSKDDVKVISLQGRFGKRDLEAVAYVYSDSNAISRQLPKYLLLRELSKEDRKKAREAAKKPAGTTEAEKKA